MPALTALTSSRRRSPPLGAGDVPAWAYVSAVFALLGWYLWNAALAVSDGSVSYALDDAYIHLAIARNFALHGVWGPTPYEAVSASSSPAWTLLLASSVRVLGDHAWLPLALNLGAALAAIVATDRALRPALPSLPLRCVALFGILMAAPLATCVATGMEHTLQLACVATFFALLSASWAQAGPMATAPALRLFACIVVMCLVRFECLGLLPVPLLHAAYRRDKRAVAALVLAPLTALAAFALFSASQGLPFEPNPIALKRSAFVPGGFGALLRHYASILQANLDGWPAMAALLLGLTAMTALLGRRPDPWSQRWLAASAACAIVLHALFARFGNFYRYEAYLIVFGLLAMAHIVALAASQPGSRRWGLGACLGVALVLPLPSSERGGLPSLLARSLQATESTAQAMDNIGHQQVQMAYFLRRFYPHTAVLLNDIGAVCYLADPHLLDIAGIGSTEVAQQRHKGTYTMQSLQRLMQERGVEVGIIYPDWLPGLPDERLLVVAAWAIEHNRVLASNVATFVAVGPQAAARLHANLLAFDLSPSVHLAFVPGGRPVPLAQFMQARRATVSP